MTKSADLGHRDDPTQLRRFDGSSVRRILPEREMTPRSVIIIEVACDMPPERGFIDDDQVVQAFSTNGAYHAFHVWALPRRPRSREHFDDVHVLRLHPEGVAINAVTVPEQVPRRRFPGKCLHELLCRLLGSRMLRYVEMYHAPAIMSHDKEHVQDSETHGRHHEEVH